MSVTDSLATAITADDTNEDMTVLEEATARSTQIVMGNSLANYAIGLLTAVVVLILSVMLAGEFIAAMPTDHPFSTQMTEIQENVGTAFTIFAVTLLIVPIVAALLLVRGLGGGVTGGR